MAIVIEQEKNKKNPTVVLGAFFVALAIGITIYYLFFVNPEKIEKFTASSPSLLEFEKINFQPEELLNNPEFSVLRSEVEFISPPPELIGKTSPFSP